MAHSIGLAGFEAAVRNFREDRRKYSEIVNDRDYVIPRYQQIFSQKHQNDLTIDEFRKFLRPKECRHWSCLNRSFPTNFRKTKILRVAIRHLLNESLPLNERFDEFTKPLCGVGRAIASAVLLITDPKKYGVWNHTTEDGLKKLGRWPSFPHGSSQGRRYEEINKELVNLAQGRVDDLWILDAVWWYVLGKKP